MTSMEVDRCLDSTPVNGLTSSSCPDTEAILKVCASSDTSADHRLIGIETCHTNGETEGKGEAMEIETMATSACDSPSVECGNSVEEGISSEQRGLDFCSIDIPKIPDSSAVPSDSSEKGKGIDTDVSQVEATQSSNPDISNTSSNGQVDGTVGAQQSQTGSGVLSGGGDESSKGVKKDIVIIEEDAVKLETGAINELHLDGFTISVQHDSKESTPANSPEASRTSTPDESAKNKDETQPMISQTSSVNKPKPVESKPTPVSIQPSQSITKSVAVPTRPRFFKSRMQPQSSYAISRSQQPINNLYGYSVAGSSASLLSYQPNQVMAPQHQQQQRYLLLNTPKQNPVLVSQPPITQSSMDRVKHMLGLQQSARSSALPYSQYPLQSPSLAARLQAPVAPSPLPMVPPTILDKPFSLTSAAYNETLPPTLVKVTTAIPRLSDPLLLPVVKQRPFNMFVMPKDDSPVQSKTEVESGEESDSEKEKKVKEGATDISPAKDTDESESKDQSKEVTNEGSGDVAGTDLKTSKSPGNDEESANQKDEETDVDRGISKTDAGQGSNVKESAGKLLEDKHSESALSSTDAKDKGEVGEDGEHESAVKNGEAVKKNDDQETVAKKNDDCSGKKTEVTSIYEDDFDEEAMGCSSLRAIPKFLYKIGLDLVQQHTYFNMTKMLLKRAGKGKLDERGFANLTVIQKALERKSRRNWDHNHLQRHSCSGCGFTTESENVLSYHTEEPHQESNSNRLYCGLCKFVTAQHDVFMLHMESEHGKRGRVTLPLAAFQCRFCSFESATRGRYTKHIFKCETKFNKMKVQNLAPLPLAVHATLCTIPSIIPERKVAAPPPPPPPQIPPSYYRPLAQSAVPVSSPKVQVVQLTNGGYALQQKDNYVLQQIQPNTVSSKTQQMTAQSASRPLPPLRAIPQQIPKPTPAPPVEAAAASAPFVTCELCEGFVKSKVALHTHFKVAHGVELPLQFLEENPKFKCSVCTKAFYTFSACSTHMQTVHQFKSPPVPVIRPPAKAVTLTSPKATASPRSSVSILRPGKESKVASSPSVSVNFQKCHICGDMSSNVVTHIILTHNPTLTHMQLSGMCMFCRSSMPTMKSLEDHLQRSHSVDPTTLGVKNACHKCGFVYKYLYQLISHLEKAHNILCEKRCPVCREMMSSTALSVHLAASHKKDFSGVATFVSSQSLCILCGTLLTNNLIVQARHLIEAHGLFFLSGTLLARSDFSEPAPVSKTDSLVCKFCKAKFPSREQLTEHYSRKHVFTCKVCDTKFGSQHWLDCHYTTTHRMTLDLIKKLNGKSDRSELLSCSHCSAKLRRKTQASHMFRIHTKKCYVAIQRLPFHEIGHLLPEADRSARVRKRKAENEVVVIDDDDTASESQVEEMPAKKAKPDEASEVVTLD